MADQIPALRRHHLVESNLPRR